jgi:hypothetical protein
MVTCWSETSERKTPSLTFETAKRKGGREAKVEGVANHGHGEVFFRRGRGYPKRGRGVAGPRHAEDMEVAQSERAESSTWG